MADQIAGRVTKEVIKEVVDRFEIRFKEFKEFLLTRFDDMNKKIENKCNSCPLAIESSKALKESKIKITNLERQFEDLKGTIWKMVYWIIGIVISIIGFFFQLLLRKG